MNNVNIIQIIIIILLIILYFYKNTYENFSANILKPSVKSTVTDYSNITGDLEIGGSINFLSRNSNLQLIDIFPSGTILLYCGDKTKIPLKWLPCDGTTWTLNKTTGIWMSGDNSGSTIPSITEDTIVTPNLTGRTVIGSGNVNNIAINSNSKYGKNPFLYNATYKNGESGGVDKYTLKPEELPKHQHWIPSYVSNDVAGWTILANVPESNKGSYIYLSLLNGTKAPRAYKKQPPTISECNDLPHNNIQPFLVLQYIIKI